MMTIDVAGKFMGAVDEQREFVDRETGKSKTYQKRVVRVLVGNEFIVLSCRDDVKLPEKADEGKTITATLSKFENDKEVVRGQAVKFFVGKQ